MNDYAASNQFFSDRVIFMRLFVWGGFNQHFYINATLLSFNKGMGNAFVGKTITHDKICIYPSKNNIVYIGIDFHNEDVEGHSPDKTTYRVSDDGERLYMVLKGEVGSHPTWPNLLNYLKELVLSVELKMDAAVVPEEMDLTHKQCLCIIKSAQLVNYARKRGHFISFGTNKFDAYVE